MKIIIFLVKCAIPAFVLWLIFPVILWHRADHPFETLLAIFLVITLIATICWLEQKFMRWLLRRKIKPPPISAVPDEPCRRKPEAWRVLVGLIQRMDTPFIMPRKKARIRRRRRRQSAVPEPEPEPAPKITLESIVENQQVQLEEIKLRLRRFIGLTG
jgi:hypothetical protein